MLILSRNQHPPLNPGRFKGQELDRDANRTTRYTEAIKQLGDKDSLAIQLGGIYALERIAQDSERDRQTILDVLCAYLKAKSPKQDGEQFIPMKSDTAAAAIATSRITQLSNPKSPIVLPSTNLHLVDLTGAVLTNADLTTADLTTTVLARADLTSANLIGADLSHADLTSANLTNANLTNAVLIDANFTGANLIGADLSHANMTRANLTNANLTGVNLDVAAFYDTDLTGANLTGAHRYEASEPGSLIRRVLVTKQYLLDTGAINIDTVSGLSAEDNPDLPGPWFGPRSSVPR